ncbi:glycoside hydrolase family 36 protein [Victivallis vadensis]|uniref:Melibiase n=1 Tax=Victivallis vadensis TaxID=172901 RepID=A0A2U1AJF0_9BACT|nr:glycoside hydrolase family 36 protein [Victivallis vadensis]PVY36554.1 melibiase [Victivallis vadensis]
MNTPALCPENPCYRAEIKVDILTPTVFLYSTVNNMAISRELPSLQSITAFESEFPSEDVIIVGDPVHSKFLLAGAVTANRSFTFLTAVREARRLVKIRVLQPSIKPEEPPEEILILTGSDWRELLVQYAQAVARKAGVTPMKPAENLTGYCTWYYYYTAVTAQDFQENLNALRLHRESYPARVVQVDDGYQTFMGDWFDRNDRWPEPLETVARRIRKAGMEAGIWLMPFQASTASRLYREHPDWFVTDENGETAVSEGWSPKPDHLWACLDATVPAVRDHLATIFRTFRAQGFTYFKMDGLGFALKNGRRRDPAATAVSAFRLGLKTIREAVPDAFLLGCCSPYLPCVGLVDMCRVGPDTQPEWGTMIPRALHCSMERWWMFDRWFRADPDVMFTRTDRIRLTLGECRLTVLAGILTGVTLTSDNLGTLPAERLALLRRAAQLRMRNVRPAKWRLNCYLNTFSGTVDGKAALAVMNETEQEMTVEFSDFNLPEELEEILQPAGMQKNKIIVPRHDAVLLVAPERRTK